MTFFYPKKIKNRIAYRLLFFILLFSGFVTLSIAASQLYIEYNRDIDKINTQFVRIENSFSKQIADALWFFNENNIKLQLEGISNLRDIDYLELTGEGNVIISVGKKPSEGIIERTLPIIYMGENSSKQIGSLKITASMANIYSRLLNRLVTILITQGIMTFMITLFTYLLFHYLVVRHLVSIDDYLKRYRINKQPEKLKLQRKSAVSDDELDQMVSSINEGAKNLHESYDNLEKKVYERTRNLQEALEEVKTLSGLLPICAHCKKIRDDKGYWNQIEAYIGEHSDVDFSHSICPDCIKKHYPDF